MRYATDKLKAAWKAYVDNKYVQDVLETALMAGGSAGYQMLFTDLDDGDILRNTLIGAGLGLGARPVGEALGGAIGRPIDKIAPNLTDPIRPYLPYTRDGQAAMLKTMRQGEMPKTAINIARDANKAKYNTAYKRFDGSTRDHMEALLSYYARSRADNIVQGGYAFVSPFFSNNSSEQNVPATT